MKAQILITLNGIEYRTKAENQEASDGLAGITDQLRSALTDMVMASFELDDGSYLILPELALKSAVIRIVGVVDAGDVGQPEIA